MEPIQHIIDVLQQLVQRHEMLLILEERKQHVLIEGSANELVPILHEESKLIKQMTELESIRATAVEEFARLQGFGDDSLSMSDLVKLVTNHELKGFLTRYSEQLLDLVRQLRVQNEHNQKLIEQSLSYIQFSLDLMTEVPERHVTYGKPDASSQQGPATSGRSFFDRKA
jgi:flagellar biosynthesis/type III secretory pathway chaperone